MDTVGTRLTDTSLDPSSLSYLQTISLKVEDFFFKNKRVCFISGYFMNHFRDLDFIPIAKQARGGS